MARTLNNLTDAKAKAEKKPGRHSDGGGLYLNVSPTGSKSWLFMWTRDGKRREMGLGAYPAITLSDARAHASEYRKAVAQGRDPIAEKAKEVEPTFGDCADKLVASIEGEWRNEKHRYQWTQTLTNYCGAIRDTPVSKIGTAEVLSVLTPLWSTKAETASRLRGRIERVLDFAKVKGWREGENPAAWRGNLRNVLPRRQKLQRGHLAAMPYRDVPAFTTQKLRPAEGLASRAIELAILTASRTGEVLGAKWSEIDFDKKLWNVPKERMKDGRPHTVPLSKQAHAMLTTLKETRTSDFIFPGQRIGKPLSNMAMLMFMRRLKSSYTVHGFRSAFRDWCGDETSFPRELAEAALSHKVGNEVERAYRRSDALEKRRKMMQAWADFCHSAPSAKVIPMTRGRA